MKWIAAIVAGFLISCSAFAKDGKVSPECFPAETIALIRLDFQKLRMVPLVMEILNAKTNGYDIFVENIGNWSGFDLEMASVCWISACGKDRVVIVFEGDFDKQAIMERVPMIDKAQIVHRENALLAVMLADDKKPGQFNLAVLTEDGRVILGNPPLVDELLAAEAGHDAGLPKSWAETAAKLNTPKATVQAALFKLPEKELKKNPWMSVFTNGLIHADLDDVLTVSLSVGTAKQEALEPLCKMLEGFRDFYATLDENQQRLNPIVEALLAKGKAAVKEGRLVVDIEMEAEFVESFARDKWLK